MATIAFNDAWVMSAWGKANGIKGDDIVCLAIPLISPTCDIRSVAEVM